MGALEPNVENFQAHPMYSEPQMPKKVWSPNKKPENRRSNTRGSRIDANAEALSRRRDFSNS